MADQNFVDYVKICGRSGHGGAGSSHFYRDKTNSKGGPDGGDGGRGGHIILKGNSNVWTLLSLKYRKHVIASNGKDGAGNNATGASGDDVILEVPLGTVARDVETGNFEFEITKHDETRILVPGGRGGKGNAFFKSAANRIPDHAQPGELGKEEWKILELKVLADVGLVGFPNAGKSSLLASLSAAKPEVAQYAFTTLTPNLGIVAYRDHRSFIMADIPGIIENAHLGKGLGLRFLRHIERNSVLLFMVTIESNDISADYGILLNELQMYNPELMDKPRILAITKVDIVEEEYLTLIRPEIHVDIPFYFISSVSGYGIEQLKDGLWKAMEEG
ncbi:MAG: GTPase ObgE [Lewinellaceae bacterium]|nr:GTPase ObgE [Lewinellaceae bacterium]